METTWRTAPRSRLGPRLVPWPGSALRRLLREAGDAGSKQAHRCRSRVARKLAPNDDVPRSPRMCVGSGRALESAAGPGRPKIS